MHGDITDNLNLQVTLRIGDVTHTNSMTVKIQCIKRTDNMSSLSPNEDARMKSPRKSVGQMLHYLARDYIKHKRGKGGKKLGGGGTKPARERDGKVGTKKSLSPFHQVSPRRTIIEIPVLQYQRRSQGGQTVVLVRRNWQKSVSPRRMMIAI